MLAYGWLARERLDEQARGLYFIAGAVVLWVALETPIDTVADRQLQSVHMLQHVLLGLLAPPLLLLGVSRTMASRLLDMVPPLRLLVEPVPAQVAAAVVMVAWHLPRLYDLTIADERVHVVEHLTFIGAGVVLWWPVLAGTGDTIRGRLGEGWKFVYILIATIPQDAVALILQFSREVFYSAYARIPNLGPGYTAVTDQNVAGVVLMLLGKASFAVALLAIFFRWVNRETRADLAEPAG